MKQIVHFLYFLLSMLSSYPVIAQAHKKYTIEWTVAGNLPGQNSGLAGAFTGVTDKWLWIGGGANFPDALPWEGGKKKYHNKIYLFQRSGVNKDRFIAQAKAAFIPIPLAYGVSVQAGKTTICVGGENDKGHTATVYRISMREKDTALVFEQLPDLPIAVSNASGTYYNGNIFIAGGETDQGTCNYFFVLDTRDIHPAWKKLQALPAPVSHSVLITQAKGDQTSLYLIGGRTKTASGISLFYDNVYEYDLQNDRWKSCHKMPYALSAHTSVPMHKDLILVAGGDKGETFREVERMIAAISKETDPIQKEKLVQEKNNLLRNHPGFNKEVLLYNTITDEWISINKMPIDARVTTTAIVWHNTIIIPSGEIRAGIRTPQILLGKWVVK